MGVGGLILNAFAFVLIGMQLRPIWARREAGGARADALVTAAVVLEVTISARFAWVLAYGALTRWRLDRAAASGRPRSMQRVANESKSSALPGPRRLKRVNM